ncbi:MAG: hypothetical protein QNL04_06065, partial [SAR324 cluster bacterium]|nr:hypothetical protein [SAR324 cluster bacterium]
MIRLLLVFAASSLLVISGCTAPTYQYQPYPDANKITDDPSMGRITVIRPPGGLQRGIPTEITSDGKTIGSLGPGSYLSWEAAPGTVKVISRPSLMTKAVDVEVKAGEQVFLQAKVSEIPFTGIIKP